MTNVIATRVTRAMQIQESAHIFVRHTNFEHQHDDLPDSVALLRHN
jgi:hypothetical protein